jgi:hypothetical protein
MAGMDVTSKRGRFAAHAAAKRAKALQTCNAFKALHDGIDAVRTL